MTQLNASLPYLPHWTGTLLLSMGRKEGRKEKERDDGEAGRQGGEKTDEKLTMPGQG